MDQDKPDESIPCSAGCGFFGRAATAGMCSKCYKEHAKRSGLDEPAKVEVKPASLPALSSAVAPAAAAALPPAGDDQEAKKAAPQVDRTRCAECKKKVGLTGIECRCGNVYCGAHRIAEKHTCTFDFKAYGRKNIEKANEKVVAQSLEKL